MSAVDGTVGPWSLLAPIRTRMRAVVALSVLSSVATVASLVGIIDIAMTYPEAPVHRTDYRRRLLRLDRHPQRRARIPLFRHPG